MLMILVLATYDIKISAVPLQGQGWNPPELELKLNMVEMHQWKQQSNSVPQIC